MTKSNVLGYVAAFPIPEVLQGINAFIRGARSVNPKAEVRVIWVNSWYDPGKEREAAMTLIAQKAAPSWASALKCREPPEGGSIGMDSGHPR